jgi:antitoxin YefM
LPDSAVESMIEFIDDMAKARRNAEYMAMIDRSMKDLEEGRGIVKTMEELEAMAND